MRTKACCYYRCDLGLFARNRSFPFRRLRFDFSFRTEIASLFIHQQLKVSLRQFYPQGKSLNNSLLSATSLLQDYASCRILFAHWALYFFTVIYLHLALKLTKRNFRSLASKMWLRSEGLKSDRNALERFKRSKNSIRFIGENLQKEVFQNKTKIRRCSI